MLTIGIDPGKTGALCLAIDGEPLKAYKVPTCVVPGGRGGTQRQYDVGGMVELLRDCLRDPWRAGLGEYDKPDLIVIERTQAGGGGLTKGTKAAHSLGRCGGLWHGMAAALGWRCITVRPVDWQRAMFKGTPGSQRTPNPKDRSVLACGYLFPTFVGNGGLRPTERSRKPDHNIADAALLAAYAHSLARDA